MILGTAYGLDIAWEDDPWVAMGQRSQIALSESGRPGVYLVDTFSWLKHIPGWVPGAKFQADALRFKQDLSRMAEESFDRVKQMMVCSRYLFMMVGGNLTLFCFCLRTRPAAHFEIVSQRIICEI